MKRLLLLVVSAFYVVTASAAGTPGLNYNYYEGTWNSLPNFFALTPVKQGVTANVDISVRKKNTSYAFLWQGLITIKVAGEYTFYMNSDDGSKLFIGTYGNSVTPLIGNDGLHANKSDSGKISLNAGDYPITIAYFQNDGGQTMEVNWSSNTGIAKQKIPDNVLTHPGASLNYSYYHGSWTTLPDFNLLTPVKKGVKKNFDMSVRTRDTSYGFMWKGFITIPANGTYTFETSSDDGSKLYIYTDKTAIVNNDGLHAAKPATGKMTLNAGTYPITVSFFQKDGGQDLKVYWSSNTGITRQLIPDIAFAYPPTVVNYSYFEGTWTTLPDFTRLAPTKIGLCVNIDLGVRNRDTAYGVMWKSAIDIPATGDYTFETSSDDGSKLYINNNATPIVNNDGIHANTIAKGTTHLTKGVYPITATFFQNSGGNKMEVYWSSNAGLKRQLIPSSAFVQAVLPIDTPDTNIPVDTSVSGGLRGLHNYYFSTSTGDDTRSSAQAQNPATPWKTLNQLNDYFPYLQPGDAVLFKRDEIFDGYINVSKSGAAGSSIIFSAYGSGKKPVISGFAEAKYWTPKGGNIYSAPLPEGAYLNLVTINDEVKQMGRYPNTKYLTIDSRSIVYAPAPVYTGPGTFTDADLPVSANNWTGAEAVIRKNDYTMDRCLITGHSGTTISYNSPSPHTPDVGYGYFIQNSPKTLDAEGEWYYDPINKIMSIYTNKDPYTLTVRGSIISTLVVADNKSNLIFDNLRFQGSDTSAFRMTNGSSDIVIQKCDFNYAGVDVIYGNGLNHITFNNNTINNTNSFAVYLYKCDNVTVQDNIIKNTGILPGMGLSNQAGYGGIYVNGSNTVIERNVVDSTGTCAVSVNGGSNILVRNNFISNFCLTLSDGAGIYTNGDDNFVGRKIIDNVVVNGSGSFLGTTAITPRAASGIYLDELSAAVEVAGNTVYNCVSNGIYLHQAYDNIIRDNTLVSNELAGISVVDDLPGTARIRNNWVTGNILYAKKSTQMLIHQGSTTDDLYLFGRYDSNFYCRPFDIGGYISTQYKTSQKDVYSFYDLEGWNNKYPDRGINSIQAPAITPYTVKSAGANMIVNGTFDNNVDGVTHDGGTNVTLDVKLDGNAAKFSSASSDPLVDLGAVIDIGPVVAGKVYRIRFSLIGSKDAQNIISYVRVFNDPDYHIDSEIKHFSLVDKRVEAEYFYKATANIPDVKLTFVAVEKSLPFWIDNVEAKAVDVVATNIEDSVRFEYNATNTVKTITLAGSYTDYKNTVYSNQIQIQPYKSVVLTKVKSQNGQALASNGNDSVKASLTAVVLSQNKTADPNKEKDLQRSSIYPNPVADILAAVISTEKTGNISMTISDQSGRVIQSISEVKKNVIFQKTINVGALHTGLYYLQIKFSDGTSMTKPFLKQ